MHIQPLGQYRLFSTSIFAERDEVACDAISIGDFRFVPSGNALKDSAGLRALAKYWLSRLEVASRHSVSYDRFQTFILAGGQTIPVDHLCAEVNGTALQLHFTAGHTYVHVGEKRVTTSSVYRGLRLFASAMRNVALGRRAKRAAALRDGQHQIDFLLEVAANRGSRTMAVNATLLIDGAPALKAPAYLFDLATVLAYGARPSPTVYPFTCSCGVAGCAGIHDPSSFEVRGDEFVWLMPDEPFRESLRPGLAKAGEPLEFRFDRVQYEAALERTTRELGRLGRRCRRPVAVSPTGDFEGRREVLPVRRQILEDRKQMLDWDARMAWRERVWGELLGQELRFDMPNGYVYSIPLENLGHALVEGLPREEVNAFIESSIVPEMSKGLDAIATLARSLEWSGLQLQIFMHRDSPKGVDDECYCGIADWPEVRLSIEDWN
jgi:hypothetical protein